MNFLYHVKMYLVKFYNSLVVYISSFNVFSLVISPAVDLSGHTVMTVSLHVVIVQVMHF